MALFGLGILSVIYCLVSGVAKRDRFRVLVGALVGSHAAQSVLTNDFAWRKTVVIFPILLLSLFYLYRDRMGIRAWLSQVPLWLRFLFGGMVLVAGGIGAVAYCIRLRQMTDGDMSPAVRTFFLLSTAVIWLGMLLWLCLKKKWARRWIWICLAVPMLLSNLFYDGVYVWGEQTTSRDAMVSLGEVANDRYVLGGFPYSFCLYNRIIPVSSVYDAYLGDSYTERNRRLALSNDPIYFLGYRDYEPMIQGWLEGSPYRWVPVWEYGIDYEMSAISLNGPLTLYQKVLRE